MSVFNLFGGGRTVVGVEIRNGSDVGSPSNFSMVENTSVTLFAEELYSDGGSAPATGSLVWSTTQLDLPDYIAVGNQTGNSVSYSSIDNGGNFTEHPMSGNFVANAIAQSGVSLVAVTEITGAIYYSTNGTSWALASTPGFGGGSLKDVVWSGTQFIAVGDDGNVLSSDDGINWTLRRFNVSFEQLNGIVWNGSQFVAVGGEILTSPDGITWTNRMTMGGTETLRKVTWSGTQFVAVGNNAKIVTSPDGITWTTQTGHIGGPMYDIAWSGSIYVAVQDTDTGDIVTSPDGVTWTKVSVGIPNSGWWAVVWDGTKFLMVGDEGFVISSVNGTSWSLMFSDFGAGPQLHDIIKPQLLGGNLVLSGQSGNQITVTAPAVPSDIAGYSVSVTKDSLFTDPINITVTDNPAVFDHVEIRVGSDAGSPANFSIQEGSSTTLYAVEVYSDSSFIPCTGTINWSMTGGFGFIVLSGAAANHIVATAQPVSGTQAGEIVSVDNVSVGTDSISITVTDTPVPDYAPFLTGNTYPGPAHPWMSVNSFQTGIHPHANATAIVGDSVEINTSSSFAGGPIDDGQPDGTASYIFYRNGSPIQSGPSPFYTVVGADVGTSITGRITITNYLGSATDITENSVSVS